MSGTNPLSLPRPLQPQCSLLRHRFSGGHAPATSPLDSPSSPNPFQRASPSPVFSRGTIFRLLPYILLSTFLLLFLSACNSEPATLAAIQKTAATSRVTAAIELRKAFYAKAITASGAINLAHARFDTTTTPPAIPTAPSAADIAFAGAVLDFIEQCEPDIEKGVLNEFFWMRIGTLAANAAAAAETAGDTPTARALILAGPKRWQTDAYWRQCPSHDALASIILFKSGEGQEALNRLQDRPDLADEVQQAKTMIEEGMRKGRGKKP